MTTIRPTQDDWQRIRRSVLKTERSTALDAVPLRRQWRFGEGGSSGAGTLTSYFERLKDRVQQFKVDTLDRKQIDVSPHADADLGILSNARHIRFTKAGTYLVSFSIELECYWRGSNYAASLFELSCDSYNANSQSQGFMWHTLLTTDNLMTNDHLVNTQPSPLDTQSFCVHPSFIVSRKVDERIDIAAQQLDVFGSPITDVWLRYFNIVALEHT